MAGRLDPEDRRQFMHQPDKLKVLSYESYYPAGYFTSNPCIRRRALRRGNAIVIASYSIFWIVGMMLFGLPPLSWLFFALFIVVPVVGWAIAMAIASEQMKNDQHSGSDAFIANADGLPFPKNCLEFWMDSLIYRSGHKQWIIKNNVLKFEEIGVFGRVWRITLTDRQRFRMPVDLLTDLQSVHIDNQIDLIAQLALNQDRIRKALQSHKSGTRVEDAGEVP